jgi:hypothetical protein
LALDALERLRVLAAALEELGPRVSRLSIAFGGLGGDPRLARSGVTSVSLAAGRWPLAAGRRYGAGARTVTESARQGLTGFMTGR